MSDQETKTVRDVFGEDRGQGLEPTHYYHPERKPIEFAGTIAQFAAGHPTGSYVILYFVGENDLRAFVLNDGTRRNPLPDPEHLLVASRDQVWKLGAKISAVGSRVE